MKSRNPIDVPYCSEIFENWRRSLQPVYHSFVINDRVIAIVIGHLLASAVFFINSFLDGLISGISKVVGGMRTCNQFRGGPIASQHPQR